jgi:hypothetical protein
MKTLYKLAYIIVFLLICRFGFYMHDLAYLSIIEKYVKPECLISTGNYSDKISL